MGAFGIKGINHTSCDGYITYSNEPTATYTAGQNFPMLESGDVYVEHGLIYSNYSSGWAVRAKSGANYNGGVKILSEINGKAVTTMIETFKGAGNLTDAPIIPSTIENMDHTFYGCYFLTGNIEVNANPTRILGALEGTQITGITGSCSQATKDALMATK